MKERKSRIKRGKLGERQTEIETETETENKWKKDIYKALSYEGKAVYDFLDTLLALWMLYNVSHTCVP